MNYEEIDIYNKWVLRRIVNKYSLWGSFKENIDYKEIDIYNKKLLRRIGITYEEVLRKIGTI